MDTLIHTDMVQDEAERPYLGGLLTISIIGVNRQVQEMHLSIQVALMSKQMH